jgi:hypothetical protein
MDRLNELLQLLEETEADNGNPSNGVTEVIEQYRKDNDIENLACNIFNLIYK